MRGLGGGEGKRPTDELKLIAVSVGLDSQRRDQLWSTDDGKGRD